MPTKMKEQCRSAITTRQAPIQPQAETTPVTIPEAESDGIHDEVILLGCQTCTEEKDENDQRSDGICQLASASEVLESITPSPSQLLAMAEPPKQIDLIGKTERIASKSMVYGIEDLERPDLEGYRICSYWMSTWLARTKVRRSLHWIAIQCTLTEV